VYHTDDPDNAGFLCCTGYNSRPRSSTGNKTDDGINSSAGTGASSGTISRTKTSSGTGANIDATRERMACHSSATVRGQLCLVLESRYTYYGRAY